MRQRLLVTSILLALAGAACAQPVTEDSGGQSTTTTSHSRGEEVGPDEVPVDEGDSVASAQPGDEQPEAPEAEGAPPSTSTTRPSEEPERVPDDSPPVTGETPANLLALIVADAAGRAGVAESGVTVIRDQFVVWNDGSLGCAEPGQMYTQALVDGYWVVLEAADVEYDYRATANGTFKLCEGSLGPPSTQPTG